MNQISAWMYHHNLPEPLIDRVREYHLILWKDFQGINETQILEDLPPSLQAEIREVLFKPLLNKWELLSSGKDKGAITTLIGKLKMQIIPKGEYIIRAGEVANSVYFIVKGLCKVYSIDGE
jgi:voltage-gated potassium channel